MTPNTVQRRWRRVRAEAGVGFSFHELRRGAATWLLDQGHDRGDIGILLWNSRDPKLLEALYDEPDRAAALDRLRAAS